MFSTNQLDTSQKWSMWHGILAGNLILGEHNFVVLSYFSVLHRFYEIGSGADCSYLITYDQTHWASVQSCSMQTKCLIGDDENGMRCTPAMLSQEWSWRETEIMDKIVQSQYIVLFWKSKFVLYTNNECLWVQWWEYNGAEKMECSIQRGRSTVHREIPWTVYSNLLQNIRENHHNSLERFWKKTQTFLDCYCHRP